MNYSLCRLLTFSPDLSTRAKKQVLSFAAIVVVRAEALVQGMRVAKRAKMKVQRKKRGSDGGMAGRRERCACVCVACPEGSGGGGVATESKSW